MLDFRKHGPKSHDGQQGECGVSLVKDMAHYPGKKEPIPDPSDASQGTVAIVHLTQSLGPGGNCCFRRTA